METSSVILGETGPGPGPGDQVRVCRQQLYEDYVGCFLQVCAEVNPCRDAHVLEKAAQYLVQNPDPAHTFAVFPFYRSVLQGAENPVPDHRRHLSDKDPVPDYRRHLSAVIKAAELLETLCVNLFIQPWRKEIKTLKCFTGPFVYCLLPVLSSSTIQSVLASIGYLPHPEQTGAPHSEFRLRVDADPDAAMLVGFELLLARVECLRLLQLLDQDQDQDQPGPQEWLEMIRSRAGLMKTEENKEKKTDGRQTEDEEKTKKKKKKKKEEEEANKTEEAADDWLTSNEQILGINQRKKPEDKYPETQEAAAALTADLTPVAARPVPKPRRCHHYGVDRSIMEMQMTYDDLAIKGRPVLQQHKPRRANSSRSSSSSSSSSRTVSDEGNAGKTADRSCFTGSKAAVNAAAGGGKTAVCEVTGDGSKTAGKHRSCSFKKELSESVETTLTTAESGAEQSLRIQELQKTAEQPPAADFQNKSAAKRERLESEDEARDLRELRERMDQLQLHETKDKRGEDNAASKDGRQKERKTSSEEETEDEEEEEEEGLQQGFVVL